MVSLLEMHQEVDSKDHCSAVGQGGGGCDSSISVCTFHQSRMCAVATGDNSLRVVRPAVVRRFAHDARLWRCLCQILYILEDQCEAQQGPPAQCLWCWVGCHFGPHIGRVGVIVSTWFTRGILMSPECWWTWRRHAISLCGGGLRKGV